MSSQDLSVDQPGQFSRRRFLRTLAVGGGAALLVACQSAPAAPPAKPPEPPAKPAEAPKPAEAAKPAAPAPAAPAAAPAAPAEWDALVRSAKQENEVVIFLGRAASRQIRPVFDEFQKKFDVKVTSVVGSGAENADKVVAERNTGLFTGDLWMGGATSMNTRIVPIGGLDPIEQEFILPEIKDKSAWWEGRHLYGDAEQNKIFLFAASPTSYLAYNTTLTKPDDVQSWWDLLEPKWKGKILSRDPTQAGTGVGLMGFFFSDALGPEFLRRLYTEQDVTLTRDGRQGAEWLALGKFHLYFIPSGSDPLEAKQQGLPVEEVVRPMKEGTWISSGGTGTLGRMNRAPHPNAAKLFINWWLSKEAQALYMKVNPQDETLREDISKEDVLPEYRRQAGVKYTHIDSNPSYLGRDGEPNEFMRKVLDTPGR